jgi:hypothetical protein
VTDEEAKFGGYAYPLSDSTVGDGNRWDKGMTLRDWFAGQALAGIIDLCRNDSMAPGDSLPAHFAWRAYAVADAMLAAREPTQ